MKLKPRLELGTLRSVFRLHNPYPCNMYVEAEEVDEEEEEGVLHSPYSRVEIPEATSLSQFVLDRAAQHGQKVAFVSMAC